MTGTRDGAQERGDDNQRPPGLLPEHGEDSPDDVRRALDGGVDDPREDVGGTASTRPYAITAVGWTTTSRRPKAPRAFLTQLSTWPLSTTSVATASDASAPSRSQASCTGRSRAVLRGRRHDAGTAAGERLRTGPLDPTRCTEDQNHPSVPGRRNGRGHCAAVPLAPPMDPLLCRLPYAGPMAAGPLKPCATWASNAPATAARSGRRRDVPCARRRWRRTRRRPPAGRPPRRSRPAR